MSSSKRTFFSIGMEGREEECKLFRLPAKEARGVDAGAMGFITRREFLRGCADFGVATNGDFITRREFLLGCADFGVATNGDCGVDAGAMGFITRRELLRDFGVAANGDCSIMATEDFGCSDFATEKEEDEIEVDDDDVGDPIIWSLCR